MSLGLDAVFRAKLAACGSAWYCATLLSRGRLFFCNELHEVMSESIHISVLLNEAIHWLNPQPGQTIVDGTLGGGGHTRVLAERVGPEGTILAIDQDPAAIDRAERELAGLPIKVVCGNFADLSRFLPQAGIDTVDGILLDLGLSSDQLADEKRGFSFNSPGDLDLRFNADEGMPAWQLLERLPEKKIADIIFHYGEERKSRRIARKIVEIRKKSTLRSAAAVSELVRSCIPTKGRPRIHPATRTFQALRIAVNEELRSLEKALHDYPDLLVPHGRLAIISFHSLEDRLVKTAFRDDERYHVLTKKPIQPTEGEIDLNPRSRSARMRVASRLTT
jgi:16S rRNA (cytosine1402-N4)-methyltransferase